MVFLLRTAVGKWGPDILYSPMFGVAAFSLCLTTGLAVVVVGGAVCLAGGAVAPETPPPVPPAVSFQSLRERARTLAARDYRPEPNKLPESLKKLSYDDYQAIRFRPEQGPWHNEHLQFTLAFFHPGYLYQDSVLIHLVEEGQVRDFDFSSQQFDYGPVHFPEPLSRDIHFAGLRVLYPVNHPRKQDEVASFIGASYFRLLGARQRYGASFRGLAIDTAEPGGEEFPRFTEFWVEKPGAYSTFLQLFALLDSPRATGAYRFVIRPEDTTTVEEEASVFIRKEIKKLGLAPLTSMFLVGENRTQSVPDFRPEIHDSDGLLLQMGGGQWLWRPLVNPKKSHRVSSFAADNLTAFGLLQRDHDFRSYEDLAGRYDLRPSLWVQPATNWGPGAVELVEIPTPNEYHDNVVAYWVPKQKPAPGLELHWACTLSTFLTGPERPALEAVLATRISPEHDKIPLRFVIDFTGDTLASLASNATVQAKVQTSRGEVRNLVVQKNDITGGWRVFFDLGGELNQDPDLSAFLLNGNQTISETWVYRYQRP
jgi:periplasmic glucans biosynthesis protein